MDILTERQLWITLLTKRQLEMLQLTAEGYTDRQIANELGVAIGTVKCTQGKIRQNLRARNRFHAVFLGMSHGLLEEPKQYEGELPNYYWRKTPIK